MENNPKLYLSILSFSSILFFALGGINAGLNGGYFIGLVLTGSHYLW
jgi:hypothetical protein